jgi:hypothetical protein
MSVVELSLAKKSISSLGCILDVFFEMVTGARRRTKDVGGP